MTSEVAVIGSTHGFDAVIENGTAAPELRRRCVWLHHGCDPQGSTEYKVVTRLNVRKRAPPRATS